MVNERGLRTVRLLVALDSSGPNEDSLRAVSKLLDSDGLEVTALYVEDEDLLRAASLPGLREISLSGRESSLDPVRLAREMASQAAEARRAFEALAERLTGEHLRLEHRFLVARGRMTEELDRAAAQSDFVLVSRASRAAGLRPRLGRAFAQLVQQPKHVLFVNEPWASGSSVVVLRGSGAAVDYGARLARAQGLRLVVVAAAESTPGGLPEDAELRQLPTFDERAIAELCVKEDARLLVLPEVPDLDWAELLLSLVDRLPCSLLKLAGSEVLVSSADRARR